MKILPPTSIADAANIADPELRFGQMTESVRAIRDGGTLWYSLLNMISAYIDGLASGSKGGTRSANIKYLEAHFPALNGALGAEVFYENYRNATIHEFGLRPGYTIGRDSGLGRDYVARQAIKETGGTLVVLNIDRHASDFLAHVEYLRQSAGGKNAP
jgi:hypothetical protein